MARASVVAVPVLAVLASLATPRNEVWAHLWQTQLGELIVNTLVSKQTKNEGRNWPDWRTAPADKAIEHDRTAEHHPV